MDIWDPGCSIHLSAQSSSAHSCHPWSHLWGQDSPATISESQAGGSRKKKRGLKFPFTSSLKGRQVSSGSHWLELKSLHTVWDFSWTLLPFPVKTKTSRKKETVRQDEKLTSSATQCKQINIKIISARVKCSGANQTEKWKKKNSE